MFTLINPMFKQCLVDLFKSFHTLALISVHPDTTYRSTEEIKIAHMSSRVHLIGIPL